MSLLCIIVIGVSDSIIGILFFDVFELEHAEIIGEAKLFYTAQICILLLITFISKLLGKIVNNLNSEHLFLHNNSKSKNSKIKKNILMESSFLMLSLFLYLIAFSHQIYKDNYSSVLFYSLSFILLSFIFLSLLIIIMRNVRNQIKQQYQDKEFQQLQEYTKSLENMSTDLRKFKHDYSNIISTIGEYIDEDDMAGLKEFYYNDLVSEGKTVLEKDQSLSSLKHIGESPLKAIISSKIIAAKAKNIKIRVEITDDIPSIPMRILEICRIIGIFLDNAIEASMESEENFIHFAIINTETNIIFIIQNSCNDNVPPVHKLYEENFSTKGENRGLGLCTVMDIVNKTKGRASLNTTCKDNVFTQDLTVRKQKLI